MSEFNDIQLIKRRFFAMRNGVIADVLRKNGSPFKIIFGLNLPQLTEIAAENGVRPDLASALWKNVTTRESLLLAPMLLDPAAVSQEMAVEMACESPAAEIADVLCHRLIRKMPSALDVAHTLSLNDSGMARYCAMRLMWHFIGSKQDMALQMAQKELDRNNPLTQAPARQIIEEIEFLRESV